jgi:hypothetical protein
MSEEEVGAMVARYSFADQERNPSGGFAIPVDNNAG